MVTCSCQSLTEMEMQQCVNYSRKGERETDTERKTERDWEMTHE